MFCLQEIIYVMEYLRLLPLVPGIVHATALLAWSRGPVIKTINAPGDFI